ncbi:MAG: MobA/MobL family protein, partial [Acidobacteriota bacterium]|nr:MobA/MobL family protein [Acidobacteriota bacterium]
MRKPRVRLKRHDVYCHCNVKTGTRASGQSAAAKYDYISRTGKYEQQAGRPELVHLESGCMPSFASSDARLYWSAADSHERSNGRLFRSLTAALPNTLDASERLELSRRFASQVTGGELPYTLALHAGRSKEAGVEDNPHLHLVFSERVNDGLERGAAQWFRRAAPKKGDPASGGARKTERTKPRAWLEETRSAWAGEMNLAFERAGVEDRVTAESHATQLSRARAAGDTALEARLLLNPPSSHIGPPAKHSWEDRPGRSAALKLDRYLAAEAAAASAEQVRSAHASDMAEAAEAWSQVAALDARIAALQAEVPAGERRAGLVEREASARATSAGGQRLDAAHQSTPAEGESMVRAAEQRVGEEPARREERVPAAT